jgi:hypothetical protein
VLDVGHRTPLAPAHAGSNLTIGREKIRWGAGGHGRRSCGRISHRPFAIRSAHASSHRGGAAVCLPALPSGAGTALGGRFGAGTVAFALLIGPSIEAWFWLVRHAQPTAPASAAPVTAFDL